MHHLFSFIIISTWWATARLSQSQWQCIAFSVDINTSRLRPPSQLQSRGIDIVHIPYFAGIGVTSILPVPSTNDDEYYIGTKRGKVKQILLPPTANLQDETETQMQKVQVHDIEDANGKALKPYPVFSMMSVPHNHDNKGHDLLTGGGDRYATVWKKEEKVGDQKQENINVVWKVEDQLGPHTGWVKDLASCRFHCTTLTTTNSADSPQADDGMLVFSIGCNCIEIWSAVNNVNGNGQSYKHERKLQIDSSIEMGCTLSSDLLCLAMHSTDSEFNTGTGTAESGSNTNTHHLFAGGVDGRIHRWSINNKNADADGVISAHDGRVNAIAVCQKMNVLVSVGNDGCIHCRLMDDDNENSTSPSEWKVVSLDLNHLDCTGDSDDGDDDEERTQTKITSMCIVHEDMEIATVAVGSACGQMSLIDIIKSKDKTLELQSSLLNRGAIASIGIGLEEGNSNVIHALCSKRCEDEFCRIIIGHSAGLSVMDLALQ